MTEPGFEWFQIPDSFYHPKVAITKAQVIEQRNQESVKWFAKKNHCKSFTVIYDNIYPVQAVWPNQLFSVPSILMRKNQLLNTWNFNPVITGHHGRLMHGKQGKRVSTHWVLPYPTQCQTSKIPVKILLSTSYDVV